MYIETYRELVCPLDAKVVQGRTLVRVVKVLPASLKEKIDAFNEKVQPIIEGLCGIEISLTYNLRIGDQYENIVGL